MARSSLVSLATALVVSAGVVVSMYLLSGAIVRSRGGDEMIRVTGSSRKPITSDLIIWSGTVAHVEPTVPAAYARLKSSVARATAYLRDQGIAASEIATQAIVTEPQSETVRTSDGAGGTIDRSQITGFRLSQRIEVRSKEVQKVDKISREATDLISQGVPFTSESPQFLYTKISEVKVEILANAAKDARRRAEEIAKSSGAGLSGVRFARMSPLQITPLYSTEVSGEGQNDTSSLEKAATAIVTMGFGVR